MCSGHAYMYMYLYPLKMKAFVLSLSLSLSLSFSVIVSCQAKFMPQTNDSVIVSAARDGQVRCHVISTTGELVTTKRVTHHNESAHKVSLTTVCGGL